MKQTLTRNHVGWIDLLRVIACFMVVASHCSDPFLFTSERSDFVGGWMIGLYFIIPILSAWIKNASRKEVRNVLLLWGTTLFLPYVELAADVASGSL